jgi:hypothetical protein
MCSANSLIRTLILWSILSKISSIDVIFMLYRTGILLNNCLQHQRRHPLPGWVNIPCYTRVWREILATIQKLLENKQFSFDASLDVICAATW